MLTAAAVRVRFDSAGKRHFRPVAHTINWDERGAGRQRVEEWGDVGGGGGEAGESKDASGVWDGAGFAVRKRMGMRAGGWRGMRVRGVGRQVHAGGGWVGWRCVWTQVVGEMFVGRAGDGRRKRVWGRRGGWRAVRVGGRVGR